ncbi:Aldose 1-epimerase [Nymphon striatum]|nr:Aldose 1-epimerase [Nymphon striatum]
MCASLCCLSAVLCSRGRSAVCLWFWGMLIRRITSSIRRRWGSLIGRVANRIAQGQIVVGGQTYDLPLNNGPHHIHGGPGGLGWRLWQIERVGDNALRARVVSDHLDQGYPGNVHFEVILKLVGHTLSYDIVAIPDRETPINMAQHLYFNLMGQGDVRDHVVQIAADQYTPTDAQALPLGVIAPVEGSIYDFRAPRRIADADPDGVGHDASLVLNNVGDAPFAEVRAPNGMCLKMWGDRPCVQLYTSGGLAPYSRAWARCRA